MATTIPTITSLTSIDPTHASALTVALTSATHAMGTATADGDLYAFSKSVAAVSNSLAVISAQAVYATASGEAKLLASEVIMSAATELAKIDYLNNMYRADLNMGANVFFCVVFGVLMIFHVLVGSLYHYWYYLCMLGIGSGLDFGGYLARSVSANDETLVNPFLVQIIVLTIAPAFIMAGVYYMLGRQLVYIGPGYSWLKPRWFSYIYISCDVISLVIQAVGGGMAAVALDSNKDTDSGTHIMVAGIAFQVATMSTFFIIGGNFVMRAWFRALPDVKFSIRNFVTLALNLPRAKELYTHLEPNYNPAFAHIRSRKLFPYIFSAIFVATALIYVRCIYRLVELAEGWTGYVIRHEAFLFTLDALMVFLTCTVFVPFHPGFIWGRYHPTLSFGKKTKKELAAAGYDESGTEHDQDHDHEHDNEKFYTESNSAGSNYQNTPEESADGIENGPNIAESFGRADQGEVAPLENPNVADEFYRSNDTFASAEPYEQQLKRNPYGLPSESSPESLRQQQDFTVTR